MDGLVGASVDRVLGKGLLDRTSESQQWARIGRLEVEDLVTEPGSPGKGDLDRPEPGKDVRQGIQVDAGEQFRRFERIGDGDVRRHANSGGRVIPVAVPCHGGLGGWQTRPMLVHPADWTVDEDLTGASGLLEGAEVVHRQLVRWLEGLGHRADLAIMEPTPRV